MEAVPASAPGLKRSVTLAAREGISAPGTEVTSGSRRRGLASTRDESPLAKGAAQ